jgi:N-acetylglucosaminyldiphosphoundecaprenol N-acetyl-beta-D-mannosaminyltransferase
MQKFSFLNLEFCNYTLKEVLEEFQNIIDKNKKPHMVFTPNAELIVRANKDEFLRNVYLKTDIVTLDSWVVYYFAKLLRKPMIEPVSAANMMFKFLPIIAERGYTVYLLGASEEVACIVKSKLESMKINVVGFSNGYFDKNNPEPVILDIIKTKPQILFVAMSTPYKENFVAKNLERLNVPLSVGVGGSFDIIAGKTKHAPVWISKMGMEWFYRFIQEPRRMWKRYLITNSMFLWLVAKEIFGMKKR